MVVDAHRGETDGDKLPVAGEGVVTPESVASTASTETVVAPPELIDQSPGRTEQSQQEEHCVKDDHPTNIAADRTQGSPAVSRATGATADKAQRAPPWVGHASHLPASSAVAVGHDESHGRTDRALPLVRRPPSWGKVETETTRGVWFDKTILRVGGRVPWGRLHRGRFAKVRSATVGSRKVLSCVLTCSCEREEYVRSKAAATHCCQN